MIIQGVINIHQVFGHSEVRILRGESICVISAAGTRGFYVCKESTNMINRPWIHR